MKSTIQRPQSLCESALDRLPHGGLVLVDVTSQANIRFANNTMTTNGVSARMTMTIIALHESAAGVSTGVSSGVVQDANDIERLTASAVATAQSAAPSPDATDLIPGERPTVEWSAAPGETSLSHFGNFAPALSESFDLAKSRQQNLFGFAQHDVTTTYLASSSGLRLRHEQGTGTLEMTGRDGNSSAWFGQAGSTMSFDPREGASELDKRLNWAKRKIDIAPGRHKTILPPTTISDLMIYLLWSADARAAVEGRSVFSRLGGGTKLGDRISSRQLALISDPSFPEIQSAPFAINHASSDTQSVFDNGLPLAPTAWIQDGTLASLVGSQSSATELGISVRPIIDNLILRDSSPTHSDIESLIRDVDNGLLLTSLWYIREVDPMTLLLTGLTRDGVYVVKSGEIVGVTTNFRFNESPLDLLGRITSTTPSQRCLPREWSDWFTRTIAPAVLVPDFNCSTTSPGV